MNRRPYVMAIVAVRVWDSGSRLMAHGSRLKAHGSWLTAHGSERGFTLPADACHAHHVFAQSHEGHV
jgi:hypothetical protein